MPWYYAVAERDHELQNPTSWDKIRLLGERLRLSPSTRVLDAGAGKCGPALLLAREFGCRITAVERSPEFAADARARIQTHELGRLIDLIETDAATVDVAPGSYDVAMCLGASFIWDGLEGTLAALASAARDGGAVVVGEPYWRSWPLPDGIATEGYVPLAETVARFVAAKLLPETLIGSSQDDWDRYETLHWRALEDWLAANPDDPDAAEIRQRHESARDRYLAWERELLGWAIFVGRKRSGWTAARSRS
jgi:SAM-dependent methyltransferase